MKPRDVGRVLAMALWDERPDLRHRSLLIAMADADVGVSFALEVAGVEASPQNVLATTAGAQEKWRERQAQSD